MRIALLSTCAVAVPPAGYGGTELVIFELVRQLARRGHEVVLFATGDSEAIASPPGAVTLRYRFEKPVWPPDDLAELRHAAFAWRHIAEGGFDVVHAHQAPSVSFHALARVPTVLTLHHKREEPLVAYYADFPNVAYVAISARQAELVPELRIGRDRVVHHGIDPTLYPAGDPETKDGGYVAFLGRFAPEKGPHVAIDAANLAGARLKMGGCPHWVNTEFFAREVEPRLHASRGRVEWLGELSHRPKVRLLSAARALLFPIDWEEPFGLVMIESMLVGTPVVSFVRGSAPEVIDEGVTGFLVRDVAEMAARIRQLDGFDRARCRARALERWTSERMARDYERVYRAAIAARTRASHVNGAKGNAWPPP